MPKRRERNLDHELVEVIVGILDGWAGKLTWDLLSEKIEERTNASYTRQGLDRHTRIKDSFSLAKIRLSKQPRTLTKRPLSNAESSILQDRFERLEAENVRLKLENERFLEQFVRWSYNAHLRGLTESYLNSPLPVVDREQTIKKKKK